MSYHHHVEADFAGSQLAREFEAAPAICFDATQIPASLSAYATHENSSTQWPFADGVVGIQAVGRPSQLDIALEYKRPNEGVHGLLTALGQAHAYLDKGYNGAVIVVPRTYATHPTPGHFLAQVLDRTSSAKGIGVFSYDPPDLTAALPFRGRLHLERALEIDVAPQTPRAPTLAKTQWAHMREGSTTRDGLFRFLQVARRLAGGEPEPLHHVPTELARVLAPVLAGRSAAEYLANAAGNSLLKRTWRTFWFENIMTPTALRPWRRSGTTYSINRAPTLIDKDDGTGKSLIFEGRANSLKESLVFDLNSRAITEQEAWRRFANGFAVPGGQAKQGVRDRAHSYREDVDSALMKLHWIDNEGRPTEQGFKFATICERFGGASSTAAKEYFGATLLQTGRYAALVHYIHSLSEERFNVDPLAFTRVSPAGTPVFNEDSYFDYLAYLLDELTNDLKVVRTVAGRARPRRRTVLQAELTLLRNYGFVSRRRHRLGIGIPINWEKVHDGMNMEL